MYARFSALPETVAVCTVLICLGFVMIRTAKPVDWRSYVSEWMRFTTAVVISGSAGTVIYTYTFCLTRESQSVQQPAAIIAYSVMGLVLAFGLFLLEEVSTLYRQKVLRMTIVAICYLLIVSIAFLWTGKIYGPYFCG